MQTSRSLYEIEVALAKIDKFNFLKNIVAYNVNGVSEVLPIYHECDMLVLSKSGYLTEIEIKRSWSDFKADFNKKHKHESKGLIKYFYYCIPECLLQDVYEVLEVTNTKYSGIITYSEELKIKIHGKRIKDMFDNYTFCQPQLDGKRLFLEQQLEVARLGAMRSVMLKEKFIKQIENTNK